MRSDSNGVILMTKEIHPHMKPIGVEGLVKSLNKLAELPPNQFFAKLEAHERDFRENNPAYTPVYEDKKEGQ